MMRILPLLSASLILGLAQGAIAQQAPAQTAPSPAAPGEVAPAPAAPAQAAPAPAAPAETTPPPAATVAAPAAPATATAPAATAAAPAATVAAPAAPPAAPAAGEPPPPSYGSSATMGTAQQEQQTYTPPPKAEAEAAAKESGPFDRGTFRVALILGYGRAYLSEYLILGVAPAYYIWDGLEVELGNEFWLFGSPFIFRLTPGLRYVAHFIPVIKPYLGGFYRHWFVGDNHPDVDAMGVRFGAFYVSDSRFYIGGGAVYEKYLNVTGDLWYPEFLVAISF